MAADRSSLAVTAGYMAQSAAGFPPRFPAGAQARETALLESLRPAGVDALDLATDDDLLDAFLRFADLPRQRARLATGGAPSHLMRNEPRRAS